jgi:hypothetical protein
MLIQGPTSRPADQASLVEAMGIEPTNLLHAMQALYQLSYAPEAATEPSRADAGGTRARSLPFSGAGEEPGRPG